MGYWAVLGYIGLYGYIWGCMGLYIGLYGAIRADMCYVYRGIVGGEIVSLYLRISSSVTVDAMPYVSHGLLHLESYATT
jgi:hypothetical protein